MIEHPEAVTIAGQIAETLSGKMVQSAVRGNAPHKFAFYNREPEEYATILAGQSIVGAEPSGSLIFVRTNGGHIIVLGGGGERILYHDSAETLPKKHQLLLHFSDETYLTVSVQGWGSCQLFTPEELEQYPWYANRSLEATDEGFSEAYFESLFAALEPEDSRAIKFFLISEPGVWGIGNGYLQDILLAARLHPRLRAVELTGDQRLALHASIVEVIRRAIELGGRTDEHDLFGETGGYERRLSAAAVGKACPACGEGAIVKESFLGGAVYTCPQCQPRPPKAQRRKGEG